MSSGCRRLVRVRVGVRLRARVRVKVRVLHAPAAG